jgi:PKD repeat protein
MKKLLLALLLLPLFSFAQSAQVEFQEGKLWFKMTNEARIAMPLTEDPTNISPTTIPGLDAIAYKYGATRLSKPFAAAKNSVILQRTFLLEFTDVAHTADLIKELQLLNGLEYAERVPLEQMCLTPNDPSYGSQWGLSMINAPTAWNYFSSGSNVVIAIVDDAIERTHSDLSPNLWVNPGEIAGNNIDDDNNGYIDDINGYDVASNDNNPNPPSTAFDHGTHVAGIASARTNNGTGVASIGFSCKLMCVKATSTATAVTNGYDGIVYAAVSGADVINMSWGGPSFSTTGQNVVNYANSQGCILIAAAGNDNVSSQFYPAAFNNVISVAATSSNDAKASFSNYGSWIDVSAPGNNIYSTTVSNTYGNKSGTSMASPMVAGLAALMKSLNPTMPNADIINCLLSTADNINAQNPSYIGQLGSGRIDAAAAMACVAAALNNPPVAEFSANFTTVSAGGSIVFTDLSTYSPTSWSWSFPGGTPATYNGQNPPSITYNTPGTYNAVLTVTNGNGSDVETKVNYIQVDPASSCLQINLPAPAGWTGSNYYTGATVGQDGWINGMNVYLDKQKAMYFDASASPYTILNNVWVAFGLAYSANPNKVVPVRVYDGTSGTPGALIGSSNLTMGQIMSDVDGGFYTEASFVNAPVTLPASKKFFVSVDLTNLQWTAGVKDTLSIVSNAAGQTTPSAIWEQQTNNTWYQYTTAGSWNLSASLYVHPFLTDANSVANITPSTLTICSGNAVDFDAAGSTYEDTLLWYFPGGTPTVVPSAPTASVTYGTPGTYDAILYTIGGGCSLFDSAFVTITVNPSPLVDVAGSAEICNGGSTVLTASGATTYTWSPPAGLSATTGAVVTANPTANTTYSVTGTLGSCSNSSYISIEVDDPPVALITFTDSIIGCPTVVLLDGSNSTDVTDFNWTFPGGTPSTSNTSTPSIDFIASGTVNIELITTNNCGADTTTFSMDVTVDCSAGLDEEIIDYTVFYNPNTGVVSVTSTAGIPANTSVDVLNELGQIIVGKRSEGQTQLIEIPLKQLAIGMYFVHLSTSDSEQLIKFIAH